MSQRHTIYSSASLNIFYAGVSQTITPLVFSNQVVVCHFNTTNSDARVNGSSAVSNVNIGTQTLNGFTLGANGANSQCADVNIYSFVGVNRTLTAGEITDLETYLASKSGVTL